MLESEAQFKVLWPSKESLVRECDICRLGDDRPDTPLQVKLEQMAKFIGIGGGITAFVLFITLLIRWIVEIESDDSLTYVLPSFMFLNWVHSNVFVRLEERF